MRSVVPGQGMILSEIKQSFQSPLPGLSYSRSLIACKKTRSEIHRFFHHFSANQAPQSDNCSPLETSGFRKDEMQRVLTGKTLNTSSGTRGKNSQGHKEKLRTNNCIKPVQKGQQRANIKRERSIKRKKPLIQNAIAKGRERVQNEKNYLSHGLVVQRWLKTSFV